MGVCLKAPLAVHPHLLPSDKLVLRHLVRDGVLPKDEDDMAARLDATSDPTSEAFEPTVVVSLDYADLQARLPAWFDRYVLQPYIAVARRAARHDTDVVMVTHLLVYLTCSVPSAVTLFLRFSWVHAVLHALMQLHLAGTYTLMMHQHIHQRGVLSRRLWLIDTVFPFMTDPLMGHTWRSYFHHHVKHHHVEGNGPDDLSSTLRFQRDSCMDFAAYVARFYFLIWLDLPLYFIRKRKYRLALSAFGWEQAHLLAVALLWRLVDARATFMVLVLPVLLLRAGLMWGNWGQHCFVDADEPGSDYRSSITLIDTSNRYCFNDGYHTSHHLNPLRHWREHPSSLLRGKAAYAKEGALVFANVDFLAVTFHVLRKDYARLAAHLVPFSEAQKAMTLAERAEMLRQRTRRLTEQEIALKFHRQA